MIPILKLSPRFCAHCHGRSFQHASGTVHQMSAPTTPSTLASPATSCKCLRSKDERRRSSWMKSRSMKSSTRRSRSKHSRMAKAERIALAAQKLEQKFWHKVDPGAANLPINLKVLHHFIAYACFPFVNSVACVCHANTRMYAKPPIDMNGTERWICGTYFWGYRFMHTNTSRWLEYDPIRPKIAEKLVTPHQIHDYLKALVKQNTVLCSYCEKE